MDGRWTEKDILITVKTYPEYSTKYTETVCTAGILADSRKLIRLYPVRYRYLDGKNRFKKYQWIKAEVKKATSDNRPESYKIREKSIVMGEVIGTDDGWQEREKYVLSPSNVYDSMKALAKARENSDISLGLVKPRQVVDLRIVEKNPDDIKKGELRKQAIMQQLSMLEEKKDLYLLPVKFVLRFYCEDSQCNGHNYSILDWEICQLYRRVKDRPDSEIYMKKKVLDELCGSDRETYFYVGNMHLHQNIFCILGFFWPPKVRQQRLF